MSAPLLDSSAGLRKHWRKLLAVFMAAMAWFALFVGAYLGSFTAVSFALAVLLSTVIFGLWGVLSRINSAIIDRSEGSSERLGSMQEARTQAAAKKMLGGMDIIEPLEFMSNQSALREACDLLLMNDDKVLLRVQSLEELLERLSTSYSRISREQLASLNLVRDGMSALLNGVAGCIEFAQSMSDKHHAEFAELFKCLKLQEANFTALRSQLEDVRLGLETSLERAGGLLIDSANGLEKSIGADLSSVHADTVDRLNELERESVARVSKGLTGLTKYLDTMVRHIDASFKSGMAGLGSTMAARMVEVDAESANRVTDGLTGLTKHLDTVAGHIDASFKTGMTNVCLSVDKRIDEGVAGWIEFTQSSSDKYHAEFAELLKCFKLQEANFTALRGQLEDVRLGLETNLEGAFGLLVDSTNGLEKSIGADLLSVHADTVDRLNGLERESLARVSKGFTGLTKHLDTAVGHIDASFRSGMTGLGSTMAARMVEVDAESANRVADGLAGLTKHLDAVVGQIDGSFKTGMAGVCVSVDKRIDEWAGRSLANFASQGLGKTRAEFDAAVDRLDGALKLATTQMQLAAEGERAQLGKEIQAGDARILDEMQRLKSHGDVELRRQTNLLIQDMDALMQLHGFSVDSPLVPLLGDWAMDPVGMKGVLTHVMQQKPEVVLECGSGASTLWIARALDQVGAGKIVSLEHIEIYADKVKAALVQLDLGSRAKIFTAPLVEKKIGRERYNWYDLRKTGLRAGSVGLLLVDGPPENTGPRARYPAMRLLKHYLADDSYVVLDDCDRPGESEILKRWLEECPELAERDRIGPRTVLLSFSRARHPARAPSKGNWNKL